MKCISSNPCLVSVHIREALLPQGCINAGQRTLHDKKDKRPIPPAKKHYDFHKEAASKLVMESPGPQHSRILQI